MKAFLQIVALIVLMVSSAYATPSNPIRVGVSFGFTGPADRWSKFQRMGIELALEDLKADGLDVRIIYEDSESQPRRAVTNFRKLSDIDGVNGVIGDIFSYVTEPIIPLADEQRVLLVSPATPESFCTKSKGFFFSTATQVPLASEGYEYFLDAHPNVRKVALVYYQDPGWGYQYRDGWRRILNERGIRIVGEFESADFFPDFKSAILKLLKEKPDAFFVAHQPDTFIAASKQLKFDGELVFANNILEVPAGGKSLDSLNGIYFVDTLASDEFATRFQKKFNSIPLLEPYNGYEALRSTVKAMLEDPAAPQLALRRMSYEGISGTLDFTKSCAGNQSRWHLKQFRDGKILLVK